MRHLNLRALRARPAKRLDAGDATSKLGMQLRVDTAANVTKEFWPDMPRKSHHKQQQKADANR